MKSLKNKIPREQFMDMYNIKLNNNKKEQSDKSKKGKKEFFQKTKGKQKNENQEKLMNDRQKNYEKILGEISGSLKAVLLDEAGKELKKIPVRELTDEIKKGDKVSAVVFDGIVTQRLLDIANNKNVKEIVGIKLGNVVKMPKSVHVMTKNDFQ
jgi:DNA primase